jgi:hypothetical protein
MHTLLGSAASKLIKAGLLSNHIDSRLAGVILINPKRQVRLLHGVDGSGLNHVTVTGTVTYI